MLFRSVLLSAEPMLQQTRPDAAKDVSADNVALSSVQRQMVEVDLTQFEQAATVVDLTKGASQNSRLSGAGDLLTHAGEVSNLMVDLSATDNKVTLATEPDGRLRVTADGRPADLKRHPERWTALYTAPVGFFCLTTQEILDIVDATPREAGAGEEGPAPEAQPEFVEETVDGGEGRFGAAIDEEEL